MGDPIDLYVFTGARNYRRAGKCVISDLEALKMNMTWKMQLQ